MTCRKVFGKVVNESLTAQQMKLALPILLFMVMKRNGTLESRACTDSRQQRLWIKKEEVSSPTPSIDSLKYTMIVDAQENCDMAIVDLPAQFLQTKMDEVVHLKVPGLLVLFFVEYDPGTRKKHLRNENGKPVIYVPCNKAIYSTLNAAILAYKKLTKNFIEWGFKMNLYKQCLWNKNINGKQFTIIFHVDDLKLSHVDPLVVTMIINKLKDAYTGNSSIKDEVTITRGKVHDYLGMSISYETTGEVCITMYDYLSKLIAQLPEDMIGYKKTPAADCFF